MEAHQDENQTLSLNIVNERTITINFVLEFWGEVYPMPPEATFEVVITGTQFDVPSVVIKDDQILVYAPRGTVAAIFHDGVELGPGMSKRPPF